MNQDFLVELQQLCQPENYAMAHVKEFLEDVNRKTMELTKKVTNLSAPQKKLLREYQRRCREYGIVICYDIKTALAKCGESHCVIYIADLDIYIIIKNKEQYAQFTSFDASLYDMDEMPSALDVYYRIVLGESPQHPSLIFRTTKHNKEDTLRKLSEYFKCEIKYHEYVSSGKIQYSVLKEYKTFAECFADIQEFLNRNYRIAPPIFEEMPQQHVVMNDSFQNICYLKYPIPRMGNGDMWPGITNNVTGPQTNITINNTTINIIKKKTRAKKQFATEEQIRNWVEHNPPTEEIMKKEYFEMCCEALGAVRKNDFASVVGEKYYGRRADPQKGTGTVWVPIE